MSLERLVRPASVAIVGLSADPAKHGARVLSGLRRFGFAGTVWGVNPRAAELHGVATYPSLRDLPGTPDAVVLAIPAGAIPDAVEAAADVGAGGAILFGGGFAEAGADGAALQRRVTDAARAGGVRLLGPNSAGIVNAADGIVMSFLTCLERPAEQLRAGPVGLVTQSGGTASYIHNLAAERGTGTAVTISTGNEADVGAGEALRHLVERDDVRAIALLLETVRDGPAFMAAARRALEVGKPIVVCKVGRSATGERVMQTHTGALAGPQRRFDAVFDALGMTVTGSPQQLFEVAELMARAPAASGGGVGVVTHSGGTAVLLADKIEATGGSLPQPSPQLRERLQPYLQLGAAGNPTDLGGIITEPQRYPEVVRLFLADPGYDVVVAVSTPHPRGHTQDRARSLAELAGTSGKPLVNLWLAGDIGAEGLAVLRGAGVAVTTDVDSAVLAVAGLARLAQLGAQGRPPPAPPPEPDAVVAEGLASLQMRGGPLDEAQGKAVLAAVGVPVMRHGVAGTPGEAAALAADLGFPAAVKLLAPGVTHKTELGAVRLGLGDAAAVEAACAEVASEAARRAPGLGSPAGFLVEEYAPGIEAIVGVTRDPAFGPLVLVGIGGIFAEALDDVALGVPPLSTAEALRLIRSLKGARVLRGLRGAAPADEDALAQVLVRLGDAAVAYGGIIEEIDVNPLIFSGGRWRAADAVVRLAAPAGQAPGDGSTTSASGRTGEPVAPTSFSGASTNRNS